MEISNWQIIGLMVSGFVLGFAVCGLWVAIKIMKQRKEEELFDREGHRVPTPFIRKRKE